jgi:hypothetical protein
MEKKVKSLDDLETGIKQLLLENRCSFSDKETVLLNDCLIALEQAKVKTSTANEGQSALLVIRIIELMTKLFTAVDHLKDFI